MPGLKTSISFWSQQYMFKLQQKVVEDIWSQSVLYEEVPLYHYRTTDVLVHN